jgi:trk system potassium uptake protein TrkA
MKIIIAGAGEVGFHLAKLLTQEDHRIYLIDTNQKQLEHASDELDILTVAGNAYSISLLTEIGISDADLMIAVTSSETTNLTVAILGKQLGAKKSIARVNDRELLKLHKKKGFETFGIDVMISPEDLAAKEISRLLKRTAFTDAFDFDLGMLMLLGTYISEGASILNKPVTSIKDDDYIAIAIQRGNECLLPREDLFIEQKDHVYFICKPDGVEKLRNLTAQNHHEVRDVMIIGGGKIGFATAKMLSRKKRIKILELNRERAYNLAEKLPDITIIQEDGHNVRVLEDENLASMDAFIAVTGNSETNIMSCLLAKKMGVRKTIALVENIDYINLSQNIGIDTLINKKIIVANNIFRYVRNATINNIAGLHGLDAEVLEIIVQPKAKVKEKAIVDIDMPGESLIAGVIRDGEGFISKPDFIIQENDKVIVLAHSECVNRLVKLFN